MKQETYLLVRLGPNSQNEVVGVYPSSPNPAKRSFTVKPGTAYRFELLAVDQKTGHILLASSKVAFDVPQGESYFSPNSLVFVDCHVTERQYMIQDKIKVYTRKLFLSNTQKACFFSRVRGGGVGNLVRTRPSEV